MIFHSPFDEAQNKYSAKLWESYVPTKVLIFPWQFVLRLFPVKRKSSQETCARWCEGIGLCIRWWENGIREPFVYHLCFC